MSVAEETLAPTKASRTSDLRIQASAAGRQ